MSMPFRGMVLSLFFFAINSLSVVKAADPEPVKVAVRATDPIASEAGPTSGSFTFHRTGSTASALTVFYRVSGSATSPGDYAPLSGSVLFPAGNAAATVLVTAVDDSLAEEDETVVVTPVLAPTTGAVAPYQLESSDSATITIRDNDLGVVTLPTVSIAVEDGTAAEPSNTGRLTVARLGETKADLKVDYELVTSSIAVPADASQSSGTVTIPAAISGVDYQPLPSSFVIPAGRKSITITIQPIDDQAVEGREHVTVKLRPSAAYNINAPDQATVVISDNDPVNVPPTVEIVTPKAGDSFVAPATVPVAARVTDTDGTVRKVEFFANSKSIGVTTADNPSAGAVNPFQLSWNNVAAGEYTLTARATDDRGATADSARVRIVVNAPPRPSVSVEATQPRVLESDPTHPGVFKVTRTGSLTGKLNVSYLVSGTAGNGVDYQKLSGTVTLGAGESTALIQVVPISDKAAERSETVIVLLVQPTIVRPITALPAEENYAIASPRTATVTIYDELPNEKPKVSLTKPRDGASFDSGTNIGLQAEAADSDGQVREVSFYAGDRLLGSVQQSPYSFQWSNVSAGHYSLTARASDDRGAVTTSTAVEITVTERIPGTRRIASGSTWKYLDNGTDQGTAWRALGFNENGWPAGAAQLGYGDGDEATLLSYGSAPTRKYITTYFRRSFQLPDTGITNAFIRLLRDDGAVVYLNGTEVVRSNMPEGPITSTTLASSSVSGEEESEFLLFPIDHKLLINGDNVVAVEIHQQSITSSDISFDLELLTNAQIPARAKAQLVIDSPKEGATFRAPADITINATAIDPAGYISRVDFYANDERIGFSLINFIRAPDPGTPIHHTLDWKNVRAGTYTLRAQAVDSSGAVVTSPSVKITVSTAATAAGKQSLSTGAQVIFETEVGRRYSIQSSSDLIRWVELGVVQSTDSTLAFPDDEENSAQRFYRAVPLDD